MPYIVKDEETLLTFSETMNFLSISRTTLYRLIKDNKIPFTKVGSTYRFYLNDVKSYVNQEAGRIYQQGYNAGLESNVTA